MKASQPLIKEDLLRDKSPPEVDAVVGKRREAPQQAIDWTECKLARMYPQWEEFFESLWIERQQAKKEGRAPHWAAAPPPVRFCQPKHEPAPWEKGPSVADIKGNSTRKKRGP